MKTSKDLPTLDIIKSEEKTEVKRGRKVLKSIIIVLMFLSVVLISACIVFVRHPHYH
jgi:hypothetical protein